MSYKKVTAKVNLLLSLLTCSVQDAHGTYITFNTKALRIHKFAPLTLFDMMPVGMIKLQK